MQNIFVGWSGNQPLANAIQDYLSDKGLNCIVGGGAPKSMYIGTQVLGQIDECDTAILLMEDNDGKISSNLFFEWGYLLARMDVNNIHLFMINKSVRDLPSDLLGVWATEIDFDREKDGGDRKLAEIICNKFLFAYNKTAVNSFDVVNNWQNIRQEFQNKKLHMTEKELMEHIIFGCVAAYYYGDNKYLRDSLNRISGSAELNSAVLFAKAYIDVFLSSDNMAVALPTTSFFEYANVFELTLSRKHDSADDLQYFIDLLCNNVYGLSCLLYLHNKGLESEITKTCREKARTCFELALSHIDEYEKRRPTDVCMVQLMRAYMTNDLAHLYQLYFNDEEKFLEYLTRSVEERKNLYFTFMTQYPGNNFLSSKLEQEYMIALAEKCLYEEQNDFQRSLNISAIRTKYAEWKAETDYMCSLINRLESNLKMLNSRQRMKTLSDKERTLLTAHKDNVSSDVKAKIREKKQP